MATIIDSLLVTLGMDSKGFEKGAQKVSRTQSALASQTRKNAKERADLDKKAVQNQEKFTKAIEEQSKRTAEGIRHVRNQALTLVALFTGGMGIASFIKHTITADAGITRMSQNIGMSTKDIIGWQRAAENAGMSADSMTASLQRSSDALGKRKSGIMTQLMSGYITLGGDQSKITTTGQFELGQAQLVQRLVSQYGAQRALAMSQQFMGMSPDEFNLLKQGAGALSAQVSAQGRSAVAMSPQLLTQYNTLKNTLNDIATTVLNSLVPYFKTWLGYLQDLATWLKKDNDHVKIFAAALGGLAALKLALLAARITGLTGALGGLFGLLTNPVVAGALSMFYSKGLNEGEETELKKNAAKGGFTQSKESMYSAEHAAQFAKGNPFQQRAMNYFMSKGWTKAQAAGIVANLMRESNLDPTAIGDKGKAYGVAQWHKDRQMAFQKWSGKSIWGSSLEDQLGFVNYELTQGSEKNAGAALRKAKSAQMSGAAISQLYERPANRYGESTIRGAMAEHLFRSMAGIPVSSTGASSSMSRVIGGSTTIGGAHSEANIGSINIVTQANDADGIARSMKPALNKYLFPAQANTGLN